jgi:[ribosomal protein S5]-alanine N-acetyltransferase
MLPSVFHTTRLLLRPIAPEDAGPIFDSYAQDPEATRFLTWRSHRDVGDTAGTIARCIALSPRIARTYVVCEAGAIRGALALQRDDPYRLEVDYALARSCWGGDLITEALSEVAHWALAQPRIFRLGAVCDVENVDGVHALEQAGFIREALLRRWAVHPNISDQPRDCYSYARVR